MNKRGMEGASLNTLYVLILLVIALFVVLAIISREGSFLSEVASMLRIGGYK